MSHRDAFSTRPPMACGCAFGGGRGRGGAPPTRHREAPVDAARNTP